MGRTTGQQSLIGHVQTGGVTGIFQAPGNGQRFGEGTFFVEQLAGPVPPPPRLHQNHQSVRPQQVGEQFVAADQPGQPRLHAIEKLAVRQAVPLGPPPGGRRHQFGRPFLHGIVEQQLPAAVEIDLVDVGHRALVGHVKRRQPVHLVAPEVDPHGCVQG